MIRRFSVAASLLVALSSGVVHASPLIAMEDFESIGPRDVSLASLSTLVGTFTPSPGFDLVVASPGYTNFGPGLNPTTSSVLTANGDENFSLSLAFAAAQVWMEIYLNDLGPATLSFYDAADVLLREEIFVADGLSTNNLLSFSLDLGADVITRIGFTSTQGGVLNTGLDNITIAQRGTPVSAPPALALTLAGLGALWAATRQRPQARRAAA